MFRPCRARVLHHPVDGGDHLRDVDGAVVVGDLELDQPGVGGHPEVVRGVGRVLRPARPRRLAAGDDPGHVRAVAVGVDGLVERVLRLEGEVGPDDHLGRRSSSAGDGRDAGVDQRDVDPGARPAGLPQRLRAGHAGDVRHRPGLRRRREPQGRRPELLVGYDGEHARHPRDRARGARGQLGHGCREGRLPGDHAAPAGGDGAHEGLRRPGAPGLEPDNVPAPGGGRSSAVTGRAGRGGGGGARRPEHGERHGQDRDHGGSALPEHALSSQRVNLQSPVDCEESLTARPEGRCHPAGAAHPRTEQPGGCGRGPGAIVSGWSAVAAAHAAAGEPLHGRQREVPRRHDGQPVPQ